MLKKKGKKEKNAVASHVAFLQRGGVRGGNTLTGFLAKKRFVRCVLTSLSVSQLLASIILPEIFFDSRLWIMKHLVFLVLFYAKIASIALTVYIVGHSD